MSKQERDFKMLISACWADSRYLCIGLDTSPSRVSHLVATKGRSEVGIQARYNCSIIDATADLVAAYKPNVAFYEAAGAAGIADLRATIRYVRRVAPRVPIILDAKRADIGTTNDGYVEFAFGYLDADAITVNPYLGSEALRPFLECEDKGIFVLCRTSNVGAGEFQDLRVQDAEALRLYEIVAKRVSAEWNERGNCGLVVGATYPEELAEVRQVAPRLPILIPGIGAQGGNLEAAVSRGLNDQGSGLLVSASRSVLFASSGLDFQEAARTEVKRLDTTIRSCVTTST